MAKLTAKQRGNLKPSQFALSGGRYPIPDASHARNALARGAQHASSAEKSKIKAAVKSKFPAIQVDSSAADSGYADTPKAIAKAASKARMKRLAGYQL